MKAYADHKQAICNANQSNRSAIEANFECYQW